LANLDSIPSFNPIKVIFADGKTAQSTHETQISIPGTDRNIDAHIFSDSSLRNSLFSISELCNSGFEATFKANGLLITEEDGQVALFSPKLPTDTLWSIPIHRPISSANAAISLPSDKDFSLFIHAAFGSPSISMWSKAIRRGYLSTVPRLSISLISVHPPHTIATALGHLDQKRQGLDSTKKSSQIPLITPPPASLSPDTVANNDDDPNDEDNDDLSFAADDSVECFFESTADFDTTGRFPITSLSRNEYQLVSTLNNYIHVEPMRSRHHSDQISAFQKTIDFWILHDMKPTIVRLDNETSVQLEQFLTSNSLRYQYFPAGQHRSNRAERAIRTWKNHFISAISTVSSKFPLYLWDKLIPQFELTLNCMLPWKLNPAISAYDGLHKCKFDFRAHPIAPAGTAILIHDKPDSRGTWAAHGSPGFYLGPAVSHYRCYHVWASTTKSTRVSDTIAWFPEHVSIPTISDKDIFLAAISDLTSSISKYAKTSSSSKSNSPIITALNSLTTNLLDIISIYNSSDNTSAQQRVTDSPSNQRVMVATQSPLPPPPGLQLMSPHSHPTNSSTTAEEYPTAIIPPPTSSSIADHPNTCIGDLNNSHTILTKDFITAAKSQLPPPTTHHYNTRQQSAATTLASSLSPTFSVTSEPSLNLDKEGKPLTFATAKAGDNRVHWIQAEKEEICRLIDTGTIKAISLADQPIDRRSDTTYYNPKPKEKINLDGDKTYRIRGTIGGDRINYPGSTAAHTASMPVVKILLQSVVSEGKRWLTIDIKDYYLGTPLPRSEYLRIPLKFIDSSLLVTYSLSPFIDNNSILFEVNKGMYGLPHAGLLAQERTISHLAKHGYHQTSTPCLFRHDSNGTDFCLVVDDFGVKYSSEEGVNHLISTLEQLYKLTIRWEGDQYLGMTIKFNRNARTVSLSIPKYISKALERFAPNLSKGSKSPSIYIPPNYGEKIQEPFTDSSPLLNDDEKHRLQEIVGCLLYYCRAVDPTGLPTVTELASLQSHATELTKTAVDRLLAYFYSYPSNELILHACDMILYIQSDASYLSRPQSRSVAGGIFYLGNSSTPTAVNGAIHAISSIIPAVVASAGEAEYAALFINGQEGEWLRQILHDIGHPQPTTLIMCDNQCAVGIASDTVKPKRTKSIDMKFHWIRDRVRQKHFSVIWRKGEHNLADFFTKSLPVHVHQSLMPLLVYSPPASPAFHTRSFQRHFRWRHTKIIPI
jgi:hypothetical protein